jgi:rhombotail lipoprotein
VTILGMLATTACMSGRDHPALSLERSLSPVLQRASSDELEGLLNARVALVPPVRAAIVWMDGPGGSSLPDAERMVLLNSLAGGLEQHPFDAVTILPTQPLPAYRFERPGEPPDLPQLRAAAARAQADVLVLVETENEEYVDWNLLAITYVGLVTPLFVPGDQLAVYTSAESCAIDVRSGIFLGCAQGHGEAERAMVLPMRRGRSMRALSVAAASKAVSDLPALLREQVSSRIASAGQVRTPSGQRYETE